MSITSAVTELNVRPDFDQPLREIAEYVMEYEVKSEEALNTAHLCLIDSLGCALLALNYPACRRLLGPVVPGAVLLDGVKIPGTDLSLDPVQAAFNIGTMIRWLDYNDTWLAAEWGHPSDNLGGILAITDYLSRQGQKQFTVGDVLHAMVKAHEIQGILALENSFNQVGLDHVILVKVATAALVTHLLGGDQEAICNALSLAFVDGQSLRTYRHSPNTGNRKSWAAGDATSRGVRLALLAAQGEMGYPSVLSTKKWGFYDVLFKGEPFTLAQPFGSYVMENILFKISYPAEFHGQTAVEAALTLHDQVKDRLEDVERVSIRTQGPAIRIINKRGPLHNPADRDHCLQYMAAVALIYGNLTADSYEDDFAQDPRIDTLRNKMEVIEDENFSRDYLDPEKRSIANGMQVFFRDGSHTEEIVVEYPIGHRRRRQEGTPLLEQKFRHNLQSRFDQATTEMLLEQFADQEALMSLPINRLLDSMTKVD